MDSFLSGSKQIETSDVKTIGFDARFPNCNQTRNCWQNYVDFHKCIKIKGEGYAPCKQFLTAYLTLCPAQWVSNWDSQREAGAFPHKDLLK